MTARPRSALVPVALFVVIVLGLSALLVRGRAVPSDASAEQPAAFSGSVSVLSLKPLLRGERLGAALSVALVRDPASVAYYDDSAAYDRALGYWQRALHEVGATVRLVSPGGLASDRSDVLVVPAAPCLSPETRAAMQQPGGRGVVFSWMTGTRDAGCRSTGFGLVASLAGAGHADTVPAVSQGHLTIPAGGALAIDVPPGARIELRPSTHIAVRHPSRDAVYSDRDLNPIAVEASPLTDGALVHHTEGERRAVYFGFELETVVDRPWERAITHVLVRNALAYAAGRALAAPDAWPQGYASAAVLAQDVEDEFANARQALDTLKAIRAPATFFIVSDIAQEHRALVADLARYGEIGSHTENHDRLGGADAGTQRTRLLATQRALTALVGRPVAGLRPPEEQFDFQTLEAWQAAGGWYVFGANDSRCASPELLAVGTQRMVLIGRVANDDYISVRRARTIDAKRVAADQLDAFHKVKALGGLYIMSYHSNMLARAATISALGTVARALRADTTVWLATVGDVARWWLQRDHLVGTADAAAPGAVRVTVRNEGASATPPTSMLVSLPAGGRAVSVEGGSLLPSAPGTARVRIPALAPGASYLLVVKTEKGEFSAS